MRITIIQGPYYPVPALLNTGAEKVWWAMGREFVRQGHSVTHVSRRFPGLADRESVGGVSHVRIPSRNAPKSPLLYRLYDAIYSMRALAAAPVGADILITNCIWLPLLVRSARRGRAYVHVARYPKGQMGLYKHVPRLQTVSRAVGAAVLEEQPGVAARLAVIPPCLAHDPLDLADADFSDRRKTIFYVGRIHPEKGIHLLVEAFGRLGLAGWRLVIGGSASSDHGGGGEAYAGQLRALAGPAVEFSGSLTQEALASHYRSSSLVVYPSLAERGESFGLVPLEAMAAGCPAIVSDLLCFRDYLEPGVTGEIFDHRGAGAADRLAQVIGAVLGDEGRRLALARAGHRRAADFRLEAVAGRYLEDFEAVCAGRPPPARSALPA